MYVNRKTLIVLGPLRTTELRSADRRNVSVPYILNFQEVTATFIACRVLELFLGDNGKGVLIAVGKGFFVVCCQAADCCMVTDFTCNHASPYIF